MKTLFASISENVQFVLLCLAVTAAASAPMLCDLLPLSLEEIFMYELGGSGYDVKKLML